MGLGGILVILAVLISLVLFIVFVVKTARAWGAFQIVLLSFLFIECWVFMLFTAGVHHKRVKATMDAFKEDARAKQTIQQVAQLRHGKASDPEESLEAVIPVQGKLDRLTIDRGRVWRKVTFVQHSKVQDKDQVQLSLQTAPAPVGGGEAVPNEAAPAATPAPSGQAAQSLPQNLVVYGFHEQNDTEGRPLPVFYLGEYRVVTVDAASGSVTLEAIQPLLPMHLARIAQGTDSWTLYELLPIDSHTAFSAPGSEPTSEMIFGRPDEEKLKELLVDMPPAILNNYLHDGQRAVDSDPADSIWTEVKLTKAINQSVDSEQSADATISSYFDSSGRSVDIRLKRNEEVKLDPNNIRDNRIVLLQSEAQKMINEGSAELIQRIFVRPLNDYEELFNQGAARQVELAQKINYYKYNTKLMEQTGSSRQTALAQRQNEQQALEADLSNFKREIAVLNSAVTEESAELETLKSELSRIYRAIQGQRDRLVSTAGK